MYFAERGGRAVHVIDCGVPQISWQQGGLRQKALEALLNPRKVRNARRADTPRDLVQLYVRVPGLAQATRNGADHARQMANAIQFFEPALIKRSLDGGFKYLLCSRV